MNNWNDILNKLRAALNTQGLDSFHILEELVPIEEQMEFFASFDNLRDKNVTFVRDEEIAILFSPDASIEDKKRSLVLLSSIPDVGAYRSIETYHSSPLEAELKNWSSMALVGSRIILSSDLSGKQQVFISSGLGGHNNKLRFYSLFTTPTREPFTDLQRQIIEREFKFQIEKVDAELEIFEIKENYFFLRVLFPFDSDVRSILKTIINECNQFGDFIDPKFLFTNVKVLNQVEIDKFLKNKPTE